MRRQVWLINKHKSWNQAWLSVYHKERTIKYVERMLMLTSSVGGLVVTTLNKDICYQILEPLQAPCQQKTSNSIWGHTWRNQDACKRWYYGETSQQHSKDKPLQNKYDNYVWQLSSSIMSALKEGNHV